MRLPLVRALAVTAPALLALALLAECAGSPARTEHPIVNAEIAPAGGSGPDVMQSAYCKTCHPAEYAEHEQSTHGRAFTDEEVRLATARFSHQDCIICHTPRPIFETGVGMNPIRRHFDLEEGNTCMTCHWKPGQDYTAFHGGPECKTAFAEGVGTVEACASCHRNHGTPYQWEKNPNGKASGRVCIDCHMKEVVRPVAVGGPVRPVRTHVFPASRSVEQVARAYAYEAAVEGNSVVVRIKNKGAGHNFPTELKQRSVESLVVVRGQDGNEVARSRMVFRDPYKRPYGLELPVNTQIPGGQEREHRVPIKAAAGTVECELFYKLYYPIEDWHPALSRVLETRRLAFEGIEPSTEPVVSEPDVVVKTPEGIRPELAGPANLVDYARPAIGKVAVDIPAGSTDADIQHLIELFQFPVPEANGKAQARLKEIGAPAIPALVKAMGSWDNKTWTQAMKVLLEIGEPARAPVVQALGHEELYVRIHARELAARAGFGGPEADRALAKTLAAPAALDRAGSATAIGDLKLEGHEKELAALLEDGDPDVVRAAALALAKLGRKEAVPALQTALARAKYAETRRDLAVAMARLGSAEGIPVLLGGLDIQDDLIRESYFEGFFAMTGVHLGYDPLDERPLRLDALARLQAWWAEEGGEKALHPVHGVDPKTAARALKLVGDIGGNDLAGSTGEKDKDMEEELVAIGEGALPALEHGLKWAPGFAEKRAAVCRILGRIGETRAGPTLCAALRDPVIGVTAWSAWALERVRDPEAVRALRRYEQRLLSLASSGSLPQEAGPADRLVAQSARSRLVLGDETARNALVGLLLSEDEYARKLAIEALAAHYGDDQGYDPDADAPARREAAAKWIGTR
jgi:HEAT repeat protein